MTSPGRTQDLQHNKKRQRQRRRGGISVPPSEPIGCYLWLLVLALMVLSVVYLILPILPAAFSVNMPVTSLRWLFALLFGWLLSGIGICLLLYAWLKFRPAGIVLTLIMAVVWIMGLNHHAQGENLVSALLALILVLAGVTVFLTSLYIASGFIIPLSEKEDRIKVFRFLFEFMSGENRPVCAVVDEPYEEDRIEQRVPGNPFSQFSSSPGFIITSANHAVAVSDGYKFKGVQGPGTILTGFGDQVARTFDLRPQLRAFHVEALTKDGIKIRVLTFTPFKIDSRSRQPELNEPLPYNKNAAHKAFHAQAMEHEGKGQIPDRMKQRAWDELPPVIAERILQNIISQYDFDDLYGPYQSGSEPPRKIIARAFCEQLAAELEPLGIQLVGGGISDLEPADPQVYLERVRSWQADWTRRIALTQAKGQAQWLRIIERARAEAQADLILNLGHRLEELSTARTEFHSERVLEQFMVILDEWMKRQPTLKGLLPEDTMKGMHQLRGYFKK
jgi:regulator of protease activity HflC (stomatin/prohibitin superfamily)